MTQTMTQASLYTQKLVSKGAEIESYLNKVITTPAIDHRTNKLNCKIVYSSNSFEVVFFNKNSCLNPVIIIPSLVNDENILNLTPDASLIKELASDCYVIKWSNLNEGNKNYGLEDYLQDICKFIDKLALNNAHIIGHCLGGLLSTVINYRLGLSGKLILLTVPWDFAQFALFQDSMKYIGFEEILKVRGYLPKELFKMLFYFYDLKGSLQRIERSLDSEDEISWAVERWLHSGIDWPKQLFIDISNLIMHNSLIEKSSNMHIDLASIRSETLVVNALLDKIVPPESSRPLFKSISNVKTIFFETGHIGYLVGQKRFKLYNVINNFLQRG